VRPDRQAFDEAEELVWPEEAAAGLVDPEQVVDADVVVDPEVVLQVATVGV
jgi:hypothetical protein